MKEMFKKSFKIYDKVKLELVKNSSILIAYKIPQLAESSEIEKELVTIIWKLKELKDPKATYKSTNDTMKQTDFVAYMSAINHLTDIIYIEVSGKMHINNSIDITNKLVISTTDLGKYIDVPSIDGIKYMLNTISIMGRTSSMKCMDNNSLFKLANLSDDNIEDLVETLRNSRELAISILKDRGVK